MTGFISIRTNVCPRKGLVSILGLVVLIGLDLFRVRARHSTVYAVELPAWLPRDVYREMVDRFRHILGSELQELIARNNVPSTLNFENLKIKRHRHTPSMESDSTFSTTSSVGDQPKQFEEAATFITDMQSRHA
jgi:hypothetical protein